MNKRLVPKLKEIQEKQGCVSREAAEKLSSEYSLPVCEVYGATTFYSFLSTKPLGQYVIKVCKSLPCDLKGYGKILDAIKKKLNIDVGGTTVDKKFSLVLVNCIGACDAAPAIMINEEVYGNLTPERVMDILESKMDKAR